MNLSQQSLIDARPNDEMSLRDLWQIFCAGWRLMLGGLMAGLAVAGSYLAMVPSQYEATLLIKIGQMQRSPLASVTQIEDPVRVIERLKLPAFEKAVLESLGWNGDVRESLFRSSFRATQRNEFVEISVRGPTPDDARRAAEASFARLGDAHRALIEKIIAKSEQELAATVVEIADTEALLGRLDRLGKQLPSGDHQEILMWMQFMQGQKSHLRSLRRQESAFREALNPELTIPTMAIKPIVISTGPVYPKVRQTWLLAGIGGLLLGVLLVTLRSLAGTKCDSPSAATGY